MEFVTPTTSKRSRDILTPESISPDQVDYKRAKQLLSISSSEGDIMDINDVRSLLKDMKDELKEEMKSMRELMVSEIVSGFTKRIETLEVKVEKLEKENQSLRERDSQIDNFQSRLVEAEQYSRRSSIRLYGHPETEGVREDCSSAVIKLFKTKLGVPIKGEEIDACHRVGRKGMGRPRQIIVKFVRRETKEKVMRERRRLKNTGISVGDDLCHGYMQLINRLKADPRVTDQWVWMGKAFYKNKEGKINAIGHGENIIP